MTNEKTPGVNSMPKDPLESLNGAELQLLTTYRLLTPDRKGLAFAYIHKLASGQAMADEDVCDEDSSLSLVVPGKDIMKELCAVVMPLPATALLISFMPDFGRAIMSYVWKNEVQHLMDTADSDIILELRESALSAFDSITVEEAERLCATYRAMVNRNKEGA